MGELLGKPLGAFDGVGLGSVVGKTERSIVGVTLGDRLSVWVGAWLDTVLG